MNQHALHTQRCGRRLSAPALTVASMCPMFPVYTATISGIATDPNTGWLGVVGHDEIAATFGAKRLTPGSPAGGLT